MGKIYFLSLKFELNLEMVFGQDFVIVWYLDF